MTTLRFRPLGRIFSPGEHTLPLGCTEFAQSPQALVLADRVRVYFSTRRRESDGMYVSHVCFADFTRDFGRLLRVCNHEVIPMGGRGCFDEHGIFPFHVSAHDDAIWAYPSGWTRRVSVAVDTGIGLARSTDGGETFQRVGPGPVLSSSLHEPFLVGDPFVLRAGETWHMWYIFGTAWNVYEPSAPPDRVYKIGHATSADGVDWHKREAVAVVPDRIDADESQALPTVIRCGDRYHMVFCYRDSSDFRTTPGRGYRLGHAWSDDLTRWQRDDDALELPHDDTGWDDEMRCYPHLVAVGEQVYLLYNGNAFGREGFGAAVLT